ncbi:hypothetical protein A7985_10575 [Pseudoalteromonas luteoviolacea]|uniref:Lysine transporter LysE n=1 Tax=Pseudoalteromonas luteoviolacea TaxID=43657 RepID=A0A1C0TSI6_9GAMM|nr:LysE family translocator [Pseudoalteromonas luteoviolacea]MBQ4810885.1 LysE family translocator [Pseudoalteromonas luteoviolacea]OCQ22220.1 hypothetical protein A7985_10575 [Pseudoalteromonas luteoviolacea]
MSALLAMGLYAFSMSITPGPVNIIIFSRAVKVGVGRTIPFVLGATLGFSGVLFSAGVGLSLLIQQYVWLTNLIALLGCGFICYLAIQFFKSDSPLQSSSKSQIGFWSGAALMVLNPKAWLAAIAGTSLFVEEGHLSGLIVFVSLYAIICFLSLSLWAIVGKKMSDTFALSRYITCLNRLTGGLLLAVCGYVLLGLSFI